jgi:hypothetical protein
MFIKFNRIPIRKIAKKTAHYTVSLNVASQVKHLATEHSDIESNSIPLMIGAFIAGELVASQTDPYTNAAIDKTADWMILRRKTDKTNEVTTVESTSTPDA